MPNFVKITRQMKDSIQTLDSDCSICMAAICYSGPISAVPINEQLLCWKRTGAKFQIDISKTEGLVRVYTDGQTDMAKSTQLVTVIIYLYTLYGLRRLLWDITNFVAKLIYPFQGIKSLKNSGKG